MARVRDKFRWDRPDTKGRSTEDLQRHQWGNRLLAGVFIVAAALLHLAMISIAIRVGRRDALAPGHAWPEALWRTAAFLFPGVSLAFSYKSIDWLRDAGREQRRLRDRNLLLGPLLGTMTPKRMPKVLIVYPYFASDEDQGIPPHTWIDHLQRELGVRDELSSRTKRVDPTPAAKPRKGKPKSKELPRIRPTWVAAGKEFADRMQDTISDPQRTLSKEHNQAIKGLVSRRDLLAILEIQDALGRAGCPSPKVISDVDLCLGILRGEHAVTDGVAVAGVKYDHVVAIGLFSNIVTTAYASDKVEGRAFHMVEERDEVSVTREVHLGIETRQLRDKDEYWARRVDEGRVAGVVVWDVLSCGTSLTIVGGVASLATARLGTFLRGPFPKGWVDHCEAIQYSGGAFLEFDAEVDGPTQVENPVAHRIKDCTATFADLLPVKGPMPIADQSDAPQETLL